MMAPALALLGVLTAIAGTSDQLTISNVKLTHGLLGPERQSNKILSGDSYFIAFEIDGLKADDAGRVKYTLAMETVDSKGNVVYTQNPRDLEARNLLGGSHLPAFSFLDIGPAVNPGEYAVKITVTDRTTKATQRTVQKFEVLPKAFGIVKLSTTMDATMQFPVPALGVPGQTLWVHFQTVGFQRDSASKQPDVHVEMRILDENGQPTLAKPITGDVNEDVSEGISVIPWHFSLSLNRAGKYTVEARAMDRLSKKTAKVSFPLVVIDQKSSATAE
jgi:hypothetical protein